MVKGGRGKLAIRQAGLPAPNDGEHIACEARQHQTVVVRVGDHET